MSEQPFVSVIVPTYKRSDRLPRALDSIIAQTYANLEIIVVNDNEIGSEYDSRTQELLDDYGARDSRIRSLHTAGGTGGGAARNFACRNASGEYLAFLDDDDIFLPDKIETQLAFMVERNLDMSWQDVSWYGEDGMLVEHRRLNHCSDFSPKGILRAHLLTPIAPTAIYMLKRSLFDRTDGFGEVATGQDWWLMLRCIEADARIGYMPEVHVHQLLHDGARLSLGANKIAGEMARHQVVRGYYPMLSKRDIRYVEFRHNAVLAVSCVRSGKSLSALRYAIKALWISPSDSFSEARRFFSDAKDR